VEIPAVSYFGGSQWSTMHAEVAPHGLFVIYDNDRRPVCKLEIMVFSNVSMLSSTVRSISVTRTPSGCMTTPTSFRSSRVDR